MISVSIDMHDEVAPLLERLGVEISDPVELHRRIASAAEDFTRRYIRERGRSMTRTRGRLGAKSSGHMAEASSAVSSRYSARLAMVLVPTDMGLGRAFHDIHLTTPTKRGKQWIAIPNTASAYGKKPEEIKDLQFVEFRPDLAAMVKRAKSTGRHTVVFWLKKEVRIPQDRSLLPTARKWEKIALRAAGGYIVEIMEKGDRP